jgi:hypothetical protein
MALPLSSHVHISRPHWVALCPASGRSGGAERAGGYVGEEWPLASPVIPTLMEGNILQYCRENEEGYTAECGHRSVLHMTVDF